MISIRLVPIALCAGVLFAGCSGAEQTASKSAAEVKNAVSPIVGSWEINGDTPPPATNLPQFVKLTFHTGGALDASYVAAGGALAKIVGNTKLKSEHDTYALHGDAVSIVEGSRALDYTYAVRDGKLYLTGNGATQATVYEKAAG